MGYWSGRGATPETAVQLKGVVVKPWHPPLALPPTEILAFGVDVLENGASSTERYFVSGGFWRGRNGKYYPTAWGGNQHTGSRSGAYIAASRFRILSNGAFVGGLFIGGVEVFNGYQSDGATFGYNAQHATASVTGGLLGGWAGAEGGAAVGALVGSLLFGAGAIPGAAIGGLIGGIGGGMLGSSLGETAVEFHYGK